MFRYNNTHIFTGYLKQLLSSFNLPACKIYTQEFADYLEQHGREDPRILESFDAANGHSAVRINYLKNNEPYCYFSAKPNLNPKTTSWKRSAELFYSDSGKSIYGLTRTLNSPGGTYDTTTHEYLGDYLRFLRDYYNVNLMSLYNCFVDKICNNLDFTLILNPEAPPTEKQIKTIFNSQDPEYQIYAIPVKLFSEYTIAIDCNQGIELFCGLYKTALEISSKAEKFAANTYERKNKTLFNQPFLYDKLSLCNWPAEVDFEGSAGSGQLDLNHLRQDSFTRWDITNREKDLRLFIKVPTSCKSSIVILEGDYRTFNNAKYELKNGKWCYTQNHSVLNFNTKTIEANPEINKGDNVDLNNYKFKPISKLQLLAFNTGESHPFADRLVEYLSGSAITPIDEIPDNIKRVQRVMEQNKNYFKVDGLWENKMQNLLYDYMINAGPIDVVTVCADKADSENFGKVVPKGYTGPTKRILRDRHSGLNPVNHGYHPRLGYTSKSTLYDILGYVDKDTEKWYSSWKKGDYGAEVGSSIQNVDIYDGLYDI